MTESLIRFSFEWWEVLFGGVATLAIYSFLYRENPVYRLFEHFYIGIATGWGIVATVRDFLWPNIFKPMLGLDRPVFPDQTYAVAYNKFYLLFLLPIAFGLLYYCIYSKKYRWLAQLVIGFQLGYAGGLAFKGEFTILLPQIFKSFKPLYITGTSTPVEFLKGPITNGFFVLTMFLTLSYFFFTFRRKPGGVFSKSSHMGRWLMMGCFGAFFGSTIMARMALLVERLKFLIEQWFPAIFY